MPAIPTQYRQVITVASGGQHDIDVSPDLSHHSLAVEGAGTGAFSVLVKPYGLPAYRAFDDNAIVEGGLAVFSVGSIAGIRLVPAVAGVAYTISLSSY